MITGGRKTLESRRIFCAAVSAGSAGISLPDPIAGFLRSANPSDPFIRVRVPRLAFCSGPKTAVNVPHGEILFRANKNKTKYS